MSAVFGILKNMKLLLTSSGITNHSIADAFLSLVGKKASDITVGFIPTAAYVEEDISWLDDDIQNIKKLGISNIKMVDIAKMDKEEWLSALEQSDVIWMNGGNTYYLLDWVRKSGLQKELPQLLETRLYIGSSAGSVIAGPDLEINKLFPEEAEYRLTDVTGLGYVPFAVCPHLNSPFFKEPTEDDIKAFAETVPYPVYAIDDKTAISIVSGTVNVITEGTYKIFGGVELKKQNHPK